MNPFNRIARPYAKALYQAALDEGKIEDCRQFFGVYRPIFADAAILDFVTSTRYSKAQVVQVLLEGVENKLPLICVRFLKLLSERRRLAIFEAVADLFEAMVQASLHIQKVEIRVSQSWSAEEQERLLASLASQLKGKVQAEWEVDSTLLGGAVMRMGDQVIDASLKNKLERLKVYLLEQ